MTQMAMSKESSFLLTEIALDLLSNKFYDINGRQAKDLQTLFKSKPEPDEFLVEAKNVAELLDFTSEESNVGASNNLNTDNGSSIAKDYFDPNEQPIEIDSLLAYNDKNISSSSETATDESSEEDETNLNSVYNPEPDILLLKSKIQEDRVEYIIEWTKYEFKKILHKSQKLKPDIDFSHQNIKNSRAAQRQFRQNERLQLEHESEQLISLIKIIKKSEFSVTKKECTALLSQISVDIMTSKAKICSDPSVCI